MKTRSFVILMPVNHFGKKTDSLIIFIILGGIALGMSWWENVFNTLG